MEAKVLLVSDHPEAARIWAYSLRQRGLEVIEAESYEAAVDQWANNVPDLVVIDIHARQREGVELCRRLRAITINPVLLLIPWAGEEAMLQAYEAGVDECIVKPISPLILLAKVQAWLRWSWTVPAETLDSLSVGQLRLDPARRQMWVGEGRIIQLTNLEMRLLYVLMSHPNKVLEPNTLLDRVWGYDGDTAMLKNVVYRLRRKIEPDPRRPRYIRTVPGGGYVFRPD